jgi:hypothetical protein
MGGTLGSAAFDAMDVLNLPPKVVQANSQNHLPLKGNRLCLETGRNLK